MVASDKNAAYWYAQGADPSVEKNWTKTQIASGFGKIEGVNAADIDGDGKVEIFILDQDGGSIDIAKQDGGDPAGSWSTTTLDDAAINIQSSLIADVDNDGNDDILYACEGNSSGEGGIYWLKWNGSDPTNASNWTKHTALQIEGAWWIGQQREDVSGDGNATDIVFTARTQRNSAASGELAWLEPPADPTDTWTKHSIDTNYTPLHADFGNFFGNGHTKDIVSAASRDGGSGAYRYDFDNSFSRTTISASGEYLNAVGLDIFGNTRSDIVLATDETGTDELQVLEWVTNDYQITQRYDIDKADDRLTTVPWATTAIGGVSSGDGPAGDKVFWIDL